MLNDQASAMFFNPAQVAAEAIGAAAQMAAQTLQFQPVFDPACELHGDCRPPDPVIIPSNPSPVIQHNLSNPVVHEPVAPPPPPSS